MVSISRILARQILDSRGNPTVETDVWLSDGALGRASVPSGASVGRHESVELRDGRASSYGGKSVMQAIRHIQDLIGPALKNNDPYDQLSCDSEIVLRDGTTNLSRFGANAALSVSLALSKAVAQSRHLPYYKYLNLIYQRIASAQDQTILVPTTEYHLPTPMFNVLNGGAHTNWQTTSFQEFMVVPISASTFAEKVEQGVMVYHQLKAVLKQKGFSTLVGDEGGFAPAVRDDQEAIELLMMAIEKAGFQPGKEIAIALDPATSELYKNGNYSLKGVAKPLSTEEMIHFWHTWSKKYPIMSIEDGLSEDDWLGWQQLSKSLPAETMIVGDDLLVTNLSRITRAIQEKACNSLLLKVNQIGTLSEALQAAFASHKAGWQVVVSHRSGETEDSSISDLAVGIGARYIKSGAPARGERTAKYNQLLRIAEEIGE